MGEVDAAADGGRALAQIIGDCAELIASRAPEGFAPEVCVVLGTGFGGVAEAVVPACTRIPFAELVPFGFPEPTMSFHQGEIVLGELAGRRVIAFNGRLHAYEGYSAQQVALPVWIAERLGARTLVTTNASGTMNPVWRPGDFCLMADMINFMGHNPIVGVEAPALKRRFFTMETVFDDALLCAAETAAAAQGITTHRGVYLGLLGPNFETPAEVRMFRAWGADCVAMSAIEEITVACQMGMRVAGISLISDASYDGEGPVPDTADLLETLKRAKKPATALVAGVVAAL